MQQYPKTKSGHVLKIESRIIEKLKSGQQGFSFPRNTLFRSYLLFNTWNLHEVRSCRMLLCDLYKRSYLRNANFNFHLLKNANLQKELSTHFNLEKLKNTKQISNNDRSVVIWCFSASLVRIFQMIAEFCRKSI